MARLRLVALLCLAAALTAPCGSAPAKPSPAKQHAAPVSALARATAPTPTPSLTLNVTELSAAGQWLTVTWANISAPCASDFLALLPDGADIGDTSPLKMRPTGGVSHGNASFRMLNWREPSRWLLFRGGLAAPQLVVRSDLLTWLLPNEPTAVHLLPSRTNTPTEIRVQWTTRDERSPRVFWGFASGAYAFNASATSGVLRRSDFCGDAVVNWSPSRSHELSSNATKMGWVQPGVQHTATMTGLPPPDGVTTIFYALGNDAGPKAGAEWSFKLPPATGPTTVRFIAAADMGTAEVDASNWDDSGAVAPLVELSMRGWDNRPAANTMARLLSEVLAPAGGAQLLLLNGDISYARGFGAIWESFMDALQPVASRVPLLTVPGNHESCWPGAGTAWNTSSLDSGGECGVAYARRFPMPRPASAAAPWYSFSSGPVHFVAISTEHDLSPSSPQLAWLEADLAAAAEAAVPWKVLIAHRFFYIDSSGGAADNAAGRALLDGGLEALMLRFGVVLSITGHHHSYQRSCPVFNGTCVGLRADGSHSAPVHIVAGHAGAGISGVSGARSPVIERVALEHGYLSGVANASHLVITSRRSTDATVLDELVLVKRAAVVT